MIDFRLLGPLEAVEEGRSLPLGGRQQRAVLVMLLLHANELVAADSLIDAVWGDRLPPTAATVVQVYVSRLRKQLGRELLVTQAPGYVLQVAAEQIDVRRAERLIAAAFDAPEPSTRSTLLRDALRLWRGRPLADLMYEELARVEAARLEELRLTAFEKVVDAELELGRHAELVPELEAFLEEEPLRETLRAQLMVALYRTGRQSDALSVYADGRRRLTEELGLEPGAALQRLQRQILAHDPVLEPAQRPAIAKREERKVLSALFAEVIASGAPDDEPLDPEEVSRLLEPWFLRIQDELLRFGGTVEPLLGDTIRAVFGAPIAYEDHAERAVRAGLALQKLVNGNPALAVRVGISTGEVLVRGPGGSAFGAVFGNADRVRWTAPPNTVVVGEPTYRATRNAIAYRHVDGSGLWEAVEPARAIRDRVQPREAPLVGRSAELELVAGRLRAAAAMHASSVVTIIGEAGIGKTRLLRELATGTVSPHVLWLQGRSIPYGDGIAYWAFAEAIKSYADIRDTDDANQAAHKLHAVVSGVDLAAPDVVEDRLRLLLGLNVKDAPTDRAPVFESWRGFMEALARRRPVVLALEDVHWADDGLLDFLDHLATSPPTTRLVVLCTARPELLTRRPGWSETVELRPLSDAETRTLVSALAESSASAERLADVVVSLAGGNPLFAEEYVLALVGRDEQPLGPASDDGLPPASVHDIIAARIDALAPDEKALLHDAAVIGEVFWVGAAAAIGGRTRLGYETPLERLRREDLVRGADRSAMQDEAQYAFKHILIRDVAYSQIPRVERSLKHVRAAEWITARARADDVAELTAHHYVSALELAQSVHVDAEDVGKRAVEALWRAGERACQLYANDDAAAYFRRALELLDHGVGADTDWQAEVALGVQEGLGDVLQRTGQHADGDAAFAAALAIARDEDRVRRGRLLRKQGLSRQLQRRIDEALATYAAADRVLGDELAGSAWWEERCEIAILRLQLLYFGRSLDEFAEESERVRPLVVAHGTAAQRSSLFHWLGVVILRRDRFVASGEVLELERASVAAALEADNAGAMPFVRFSYGLCLLWASQLDEAETEMRDALALAERIGEATVAVRSLNYLALVARRRGDVDATRELATRTLEAAQRIDMLEYIVQARANLMWVAWRAGDLAVAEREARELASGWDDILIMSAFKWMTLWPLLGVALERGDVAEAVEHARTIVDPARQAMPPEPEARLAAGVAAWDSGDTDLARTHLDAAAALAARDGYL